MSPDAASRAGNVNGGLDRKYQVTHQQLLALQQCAWCATFLRDPAELSAASPIHAKNAREQASAERTCVLVKTFHLEV